jgi:hypothetical protein
MRTGVNRSVGWRATSAKSTIQVISSLRIFGSPAEIALQ